MKARARNLQTFLDRLQEKYHREEYLSSDPVEFVHLYEDPLDQEAVALVAALLAYGNVKQIRRSVADLLERMRKTAGSPRRFVESLSTAEGVRDGEAACRGFVHRFNIGPDLLLLLRLLNRSWSMYGSLGAHFVRGLEPGAEDFTDALNSLIREWRAWVKEVGKVPDSFHYLLNAPEDGSCCKRWCMFLRWMGRKDVSRKVDPGLWTETGALASTFPKGRFLKPSQLVIPLDTHTGRISQYLRLTRRKSLNWRAALEVTGSLRACDPADPVRYDFALARLGILDVCQRKYRKEICSQCDLLLACQFAQGHSKAR